MDVDLLRSPARHTHFGELRRDHSTVCSRVDLLVDVQNAAVEADVKRPPRREGLIVVHNSVGAGDCFCRVAQQRVVDTERLRERLVGFRGIDADRKMRDVEAPDLIATLTE